MIIFKILFIAALVVPIGLLMLKIIIEILKDYVVLKKQYPDTYETGKAASHHKDQGRGEAADSHKNDNRHRKADRASGYSNDSGSRGGKSSRNDRKSRAGKRYGKGRSSSRGRSSDHQKSSNQYETGRSPENKKSRSWDRTYYGNHDFSGSSYPHDPYENFKRPDLDQVVKNANARDREREANFNKPPKYDK